MCPYWALLPASPGLLPICRSKSGLIATLLLNGASELEEMIPPSGGSPDSCPAKLPCFGFRLRAVTMMPRFRINCAKMERHTRFYTQSGYFEGARRPIAARLWQVIPARCLRSAGLSLAALWYSILNGERLILANSPRS